MGLSWASTGVARLTVDEWAWGVGRDVVVGCLMC